MGFFYKGVNDNGFEWGLVCLKDGEWIELINLINFVVVKISVSNKVSLVFNYDLILDYVIKIIIIFNWENKKVFDLFEIIDNYFECIYIYF